MHAGLRVLKQLDFLLALSFDSTDAPCVGPDGFVCELAE